MLLAFLDWLEITWTGAAWFAGLFVLTFAASLVFVGFLLVRLPAAYFRRDQKRDLLPNHRPTIRWAAALSKNLAGVILVVVGIVLSLPGIPGQGILTILIGVMLIDFPGKRALERRIVGHPRVLQSINRLRARYGKPPLELD